MSQSRTTPRSASVAPLYTAQPQRMPARRRAGALLMGTALSAVIGLGYGRGAYAQNGLSGAQTDTQALTGPGEFVTEDGFSVDTTGTGSGGNAITITTASGETGDTTFNDNYASSITGALNGIFADNDGSGALSITTTGTVTGAASDAIYANNSSAGTDLTIAANNVYGRYNGIDARQNGTGDLTISASGVVDPSGNSNAIYSRNYGPGNTLIEVTGSLSADATVISHYGGAGTGNLNVQFDADIQNTSTYTSVFLNQYSGNIEVTSAGTINGGYGIGAYAGGFTGSGGGSITVTSSSEIENDGIGIIAHSRGDDVTITSNGNIAAGNIGIAARGYGADSAVSITSSGDITTTSSDGAVWSGASFSGVNAYNLGSGGIEIEASGNIQSGGYGIFADNDGGGALSITTTGTVTGAADYGIYANNSTAGTGLAIVANNVTGAGTGIYAYNDGTGALSITANGTVTGNGGNGVYAANRGSDILIEVDAVTSVSEPIRVIQRGSGYIDVTTNGVIEATGSGSNGIEIDNGFGQDGVDLTINGDVIAPRRGVNIETRPESAGAVNVALNGTITSSSVGVFVEQEADANVDLSIEGDIVSSGNDGIDVRHFADGDIIIVASGDISAGGNYGEGIETQHSGTGSTQIAAYGTITAAIAEGIDARQAGGDSLTITANNVTGGTYGIYADNDGSGALSITTTGTVTGASDGIRAYNYGTNLTVSANAIQSTNAYGVFARNYGTGILTVETTGDVSASSDGIYAENEWSGSGPYPSDLFVAAVGNVSSDYGSGIRVNNYGTGVLSITANGNVEGEKDDGINAYNSANGTSLTIETNSVEGSDAGIIARNKGTGALSITTNGVVTGKEDDGIQVKNYGTNLSVTANDDVSGENGIYARNDGTGTLQITASGKVVALTSDGIYASQQGTQDLTITITDTGSVSTLDTGNYDDAIDVRAPSGAVIVDNFGTVTGRVNLTNSNTFTNAGTWDLAGTTSNFNATGNSLVVNEGLIIAASDGAANETSVIDNLDTFRSNAGGTIRLADGAAGDGFAIEATNSGTGDFVANGGTVELDVVLGGDGSAADQLGIRGDVILDGAPTALEINSVGGGAGGETTTGIEVVTVGGASDTGAFVLAAPVEVGAIAYDLSLGQCDDTANDNWYLCNNGTIGTTGAVFEAMPGIVLNSFARTETLQQRLGARVQGGTGPTLSTQGDADLPVAQSVGPWMRTWGDFADITPDNSTAGTSWEANSWGMEAGIGTILGDHAGGNLVGGVNLRYGATYADLSNPAGTASLNAEGYGMAASLTWFGNDGFYVDGNAAVDFVSIDATSQGGGELLNDHDDVVYSASAEVGKRIELQGGTTLVPQAQLSWGKMRDGSLTDNLGNVVSFADRETLTSRIGLTVEQDLGDTDLGSGTVFAFANVLNDLSGSRRVSVAGADLSQNGAGDWFELGGGVSLQPSETTSLFGQVSYREAFDGVRGDAIALSAGLRMEW